MKSIREEILKAYFPKSKYDYKTYGNGHINDTYLVSIEESNSKYILQRINTDVFKSPEIIIDNHTFLTSQESESDSFIIPHIIKTSDEKKFFIDLDNKFWRVISFIPESYSVEIVIDETQAYQAGVGYGWFLNKFSKLDVNQFKEVIPDFHGLTFRLSQLKEAIRLNKSNRKSFVESIINFYLSKEDRLLHIEKLFFENKIPTRIVHNDTKINNLLFRDNRSIAIIDLDTVGPGSSFFDFGDAIRTIANNSAEDEKDLSKVNFEINFYKSFTEGYLKETSEILTADEIENLFQAPIYMTFIMGIRFLADYLNGDVYYKTKYPDHNLDRSKVQKKLIEDMELVSTEMNNIVQKRIK